MEATENNPAVVPTQEQIDDESRQIRRLRILVRLTLETIAGGDLTAEEAAGMVAGPAVAPSCLVAAVVQAAAQAVDMAAALDIARAASVRG